MKQTTELIHKYRIGKCSPEEQKRLTDRLIVFYDKVNNFLEDFKTKEVDKGEEIQLQ